MTPTCEYAAAQQLLQLWFSPNLPTGAFSHSHGIETAIDAGDVHDEASAQTWIESVLLRGSGRNDAILLASAWHACESEDAASRLDALDELARALVSGHERLLETMSLGRAFADAVEAWPTCHPAAWMRLRDRALPIVIGAASASRGVPLEDTLTAAVQGSASNLVWIAARLVPFGQQAALRTLVALADTVRAVAREARPGDIDTLGSATPLADLASLLHETQRSRVCRT